MRRNQVNRQSSTNPIWLHFLISKALEHRCKRRLRLNEISAIQTQVSTVLSQHKIAEIAACSPLKFSEKI